MQGLFIQVALALVVGHLGNDISIQNLLESTRIGQVPPFNVRIRYGTDYRPRIATSLNDLENVIPFLSIAATVTINSDDK